MKRLGAALLSIGLAIAEEGCGSGGKGSPPVSRSSAATAGTADVITVPPISVPADANTRAQAAAADAQSAWLDAKCASIPMDPSLTPLRPNGTGCPRPDGGDASTWGMQ